VRLLVVEDEPRIAELLRVALGRAGFVADTVASCADARATLPLNPYDAAILGNPIPILVLTARDAIDDRVAGLDGGADDYLVKRSR
jgi:DNA-binding response OmpR family regulator